MKSLSWIALSGAVSLVSAFPSRTDVGESLDGLLQNGMSSTAVLRAGPCTHQTFIDVDISIGCVLINDQGICYGCYSPGLSQIKLVGNSATFTIAGDPASVGEKTAYVRTSGTLTWPCGFSRLRLADTDASYCLFSYAPNPPDLPCLPRVQKYTAKNPGQRSKNPFYGCHYKAPERSSLDETQQTDSGTVLGNQQISSSSEHTDFHDQNLDVE